METFKHLYLDACRKKNISPENAVILSMETDENSTTLKLSSHHLKNVTCSVLGIAISNDAHLTHLDFSDCMLDEEGLIDFLKGLQKNKTVTSLNLKGNRIRSSGAQALGRFLRLNTNLISLNLEWNSIGVVPEKFFVFADGLAANVALKELNLGHNSLGYKCASVLAHAVSNNKALEILHLYWNDISGLGGHVLLKALYINKLITYLDVSGNQIPFELEGTIGYIVRYNSEMQEFKRAHTEEIRALIAKLQEMERLKDEEIDILLGMLQKAEMDILNIQSTKDFEISELKKELSEDKSALKVFKTSLGKLESSLASSNAKQESLIIALGEREKEISEFGARHQLILSHEREEHNKANEKLQIEIQSNKEKIQSLTQKLEDDKQKYILAEIYIQKLKDTISALECDTKASTRSFSELAHISLRSFNGNNLMTYLDCVPMVTSQAGDQIASLNSSHAEILREIDAVNKKNVERLKIKQSEMIHDFEQNINESSSHKLKLEQEIRELKSSMASGKLQFEEEMDGLKKKMKAEEKNLRSQLQEKAELVQAAKMKNEELLKAQLEVMQEVQAKTTALSHDIEEKSHEVDKLRQGLEAADEQRKKEVAKVKLEMKTQGEEFDKIKEEKQKQILELEERKKKAEDAAILYSKELKNKDEIIQNLRSKLENSKMEIQTMADEEHKRSTQLEMAFMSYLRGSKHSTAEIS